MLSRQGIDYDSLVKEDRVHVSLYTDPSIFTDEMEKILIADGCMWAIRARSPGEVIFVLSG